MPIEIIRVTDPEMIQKIGRLRADVWSATGKVERMKVVNGMWLDELDYYEHTKHYVALCQGEVVAAARLSHHLSAEAIPSLQEFAPYDISLKVPYAYISRLVVHENFRGHGLARRFDVLRLCDSAEQGAKCLIALPMPYRIEPLKRLGFVYFGPSGIPPAGTSDVELHVMVHYMENLPSPKSIEQECIEV